MYNLIKEVAKEGGVNCVLPHSLFCEVNRFQLIQTRAKAVLVSFVYGKLWDQGECKSSLIYKYIREDWHMYFVVIGHACSNKKHARERCHIGCLSAPA